MKQFRQPRRPLEVELGQYSRDYFAQVRAQCFAAWLLLIPNFTLVCTQVLKVPPAHRFPTLLVVPGARSFVAVVFPLTSASAPEIESSAMSMAAASENAIFIGIPLAALIVAHGVFIRRPRRSNPNQATATINSGHLVSEQASTQPSIGSNRKPKINRDCRSRLPEVVTNGLQCPLWVIHVIAVAGQN